jgi:galactose mutarotase-like enzyme
MFPKSIHVLEHVDGLVEIFSVCWPMYDAMPAFFKDAILKSYEAIGWDLGSSTFEGEEIEYPDFEVLTEQLDVEYGVENIDDKTMYCTLGAHEGYALEDNFENYSIIFEKNETLNSYNLKGNLLGYDYTNVGENTNELVLDYRYFEIDALVFKDIKSRKVWLNHKTKGKLLEVEFSDYNHLLLWTKPNAKYICIEPWIAVPDMVDSNQDITQKPNVVIVNPKEYKSFIHKIKVFILPLSYV